MNPAITRQAPTTCDNFGMILPALQAPENRKAFFVSAIRDELKARAGWNVIDGTLVGRTGPRSAFRHRGFVFNYFYLDSLN
jgi:hypothetical protein